MLLTSANLNLPTSMMKTSACGKKSKRLPPSYTVRPAVTANAKVKAQLAAWDSDYGKFPICMAKTQMSFSTNPSVKGAPSGHTLEIREVRLANGAGFIVAIAGDIMTMPGLPKVPAAERIDIDDDGRITGLF